MGAEVVLGLLSASLGVGIMILPRDTDGLVRAAETRAAGPGTSAG